MIQMQPEIQGKVKLGYFIAGGLTCETNNPILWEKLTDLAAQYRRRFTSPAAAAEVLQPARRLYRAIGLEPTKYRPSSEALLRRALQQKPFYQINSLVDCGNFCSRAYLLPIGLYDFDQIQGQIVARLGKEGETYMGIGKGEKHAAGKLVLADAQGPFGNPSADSQRTMVTLDTSQILWVIFAPFEYSSSELNAHLEFSIARLLEFHTGQLLEKGIIE